ncbi:MAG: efflux RND transporter periplasmic adaptor subunit [Selenomonadaceae bacterium]|nr:efflux RND transporter periplasmic adaptor subunit [Selenomonadaceae bacterium]
MKVSALSLCLSAAIILLSGCGEEKANKDEPPLVRTMVAFEKDAVSSKEYAARVVSRHEVNLSFQVGGEISGRYVDPGKFVRAGETLMTINPRDVAANTQTAAAEVEARRVEAELAEVNAKRYRELYREGAAAKAVLDEYETRAKAAKSALEAAMGNLQRAHNAGDYVDLKAPADGVVSAVAVDRGQIVAAGSPVLTLADIDELELEIDLPETEFANVKVGDTASCEFFGIEGEYALTVREITPAANTASRTFKARLSILNPPASVALGKSAKVRFKTAAKAVEIPLGAIDKENGELACWVVEEGKAHKRIIKAEVGENNSAKAELPAGTVVITAGIHLLKEGMEVRVEKGKF